MTETLRRGSFLLRESGIEEAYEQEICSLMDLKGIERDGCEREALEGVKSDLSEARQPLVGFAAKAIF